MLSAFSKISFLQRTYCNKTEQEQVMILSCLFSIAMVLFRIVYTGQLLFITLIWNLFLAAIPYWISQSMVYRWNRMESTAKCIVGFIVWMLFFPNSFYIITDLFHLQELRVMPLWFDLALIFSFAWNGLLLGVLSLRHIEKMVATRWPAVNEILFVYPVMWLTAFGIYIGRYLRFNSWDVIASPLSLAEETMELIIHPIQNRLDWSMIFCYSAFMTLVYLSIKRISRAVG